MEYLVLTKEITSNTYILIIMRRCLREQVPLFLWNKFGKSLTYSYLCTQYGTELYLDSVFHHRFCDCAGETGVSGRL